MNEESTQSRSVEILGNVLFVVILLACVTVPWVLQFTVAWWAAIPSWIALAYLYDKLFVPKGSLCMGVPFGLALASFVVLLGWNGIALAKWIVTLF